LEIIKVNAIHNTIFKARFIYEKYVNLLSKRFLYEFFDTKPKKKPNIYILIPTYILYNIVNVKIHVL